MVFQTRVLVTHALLHLPQVDWIYVMKDGKVAEAGTYNQLLEQNSDFAEFLRNYSNEQQGEYVEKNSKFKTCSKCF